MKKTPKSYNPEYPQFVAALDYIATQEWKGKKGLMASEAGISGPFLSEILRKKKQASFNTQVGLSRVAGYTYKEFLELGHALILGEELGGRTVLLRFGLKYFLEGMSPAHKKEALSSTTASGPKIERFIDGADSLKEPEQRELCDILSEGGYEAVLCLGLRVHLMSKTQKDGLLPQKIIPGFQTPFKIIEGGKILRESIQPGAPAEKNAHEEIIDLFDNKEWARKVNSLLLDIEKSPVHRETVERIIETIAAQVKSAQKQKNNH